MITLQWDKVKTEIYILPAGAPLRWIGVTHPKKED